MMVSSMPIPDIHTKKRSIHPLTSCRLMISFTLWHNVLLCARRFSVCQTMTTSATLYFGSGVRNVTRQAEKEGRPSWKSS